MPRLLDWLRRWFKPVDLGRRGEIAAAKFLKRQGLKIVAQSQRERLGEIDIIAVEPRQRCVVFVEVKTRTSDQAGHPSEAVDHAKMLRMTRAALAYLKRRNLLACRARFDVVAITWPERGKQPTIEHFPSAFEAVGRGQLYS